MLFDVEVFENTTLNDVDGDAANEMVQINIMAEHPMMLANQRETDPECEFEINFGSASKVGGNDCRKTSRQSSMTDSVIGTEKKFVSCLT
jgi:hypothetical protein